MSSDTTKKRKVDGDNCCCDNTGGGGDNTAASAVRVEDVIAEMKVQMTRMKNEINGMKGRQSEIDELKKTTNDLTKENKFLKAKCESLERRIQILVEDKKWEYSAPDIPRSHWVERGFDDEYIQLMQKFLAQIKQVTCFLRNGGVVDDWITLGDEENNTALLYDDLLLPHWREFANAMQLYQEEESFGMSISNLQLSTSIIDLLKPVLKHKPIMCIDLQNNSFVSSREGVEFAANVMASNEVLKTFYWTNNTINSTEDVHYLVNALISHPTIERIRLDGCFGEEVNENDVLRSLLTSSKNFASIDLDNNSMTDGITAISDYLAINPTLKELCLRNNDLNDEDARLLSQALKHNTNLGWLSLDRNNITRNGSTQLRDAVYDPTSLNSLSDCNHTCSIRGIDFGDVPVNLFGFTSSNSRRKKIYHLLSLRNREGINVHHLNSEFGDEDEDSLALVPNVLECVHHYTDRPQALRLTSHVPPLSIMYEILRGWKMPELYERRS